MKNATKNQLEIEFSLGKHKRDNCPQQRNIPDFKSFAEFMLTTTSDAKGKLFICAPFSVGPHDYPEKNSGEKSWRLGSHTLPRRFLSLDLDGMPPAVWVWLRQWLRSEGLNCCWYTTTSHTAEWPRARLIIELSRLVAREEGTALGMAFQAHIESHNPDKGSIKFDQTVYRGEQPCFLPVINEKTKQETANDQDSTGSVIDGKPLDVDYFLQNVPAKTTARGPNPAIGAWQQKMLAEQTKHIESFKQALREWAEAGATYEFNSPIAQDKEHVMHGIGSVWHWCWQFDQQSQEALISELTKIPVTELDTNGRIKWIAVVTLAARFAPVGSPGAQEIKSAMFDWSEKHECYEDDYEKSVADFEQVWAEGEASTKASNTPIKTLLSMRKRKLSLPKLIMSDGNVEDVLARPLDISDALNNPNLSYAQLRANADNMFSVADDDSDKSQMSNQDSNPYEDEEPQQLPLLTGSEVEIVTLFNQTHFVTIEGALTFVFKETFDPELERATLYKITFAAFKGLHNQVTSIAGKPRRIAEVWLNSPARRTYTNGMVFIPGGKCPDQTYNLWRGFGVNPAPGPIEPILSYLEALVCKNDRINYQYLLNWLACGVQNPERQGEVAVVLRGLKGVGKSTLGRLMLLIYGRHGMQITNSKHLVGNFNGHLRTTAFLFADEAFFAGDRVGENVLKGLVTEPHVVIEKKGIDPLVARNQLKILMCSNNEWVVPASADERRFFILDVSDEKKGQLDYWKKLNTFVGNGGAAAFLYHLQQIDLSQFDVRAVPNTVGLDSQKLQSLGVVESVIYDWLYHGRAGYQDWATNANCTIPCRTLTEAMIAHCKDNFRHRFDTPTPEIIGKKLRLLVGAKRQQKREKLDRGYIYVMPNLDDARKLFCQHIGLLDAPWGVDDLPTEDAA